jgi:hypothetical protein
VREERGHEDRHERRRIIVEHFDIAARLSYRGVRSAGCCNGPPPPTELSWLAPDDSPPLLAMWLRGMMLLASRVLRRHRRWQRPTRASGAGREGMHAAFHPLSGQLAAGDPSPWSNRAGRGRRPPDDVRQRRQLTDAAAITAALGLEDIPS